MSDESPFVRLLTAKLDAQGAWIKRMSDQYATWVDEIYAEHAAKKSQGAVLTASPSESKGDDAALSPEGTNSEDAWLREVIAELSVGETPVLTLCELSELCAELGRLGVEACETFAVSAMTLRLKQILGAQQ